MKNYKIIGKQKSVALFQKHFIYNSGRPNKA